MTPTTILTIHALIAISFAVPLLLTPSFISRLYGTANDASSHYLARLLGAAFLAFAVIAWMARTSTDVTALSAICAGFTIGSAAGLLASIKGQLGGTLKPMGWSTVLIYAFLTLGYGSAWMGLGR